MIDQSLSTLGYAIVDFSHLQFLYQIQKIVKDTFPCHPTEIHREDMNDEQRLLFIKNARNCIIKEELVQKFFMDNAKIFINLLGPDIDIQSEIYLRASRPNYENDFIDWHRDTFYGNSFWELVCWFPVFSLEKGAGLMMVESSHLETSNNIHSIKDKNDFRSKVKKGSLANELGYLYLPKTDDTISNLDQNRVKLLTPTLGQGIIFFTHMIHRAHNSSSTSRVSIDLKVKNMFAPTHTRKEYFQPLLRGCVTQCVEKMKILNRENEESTE